MSLLTRSKSKIDAQEKKSNNKKGVTIEYQNEDDHTKAEDVEETGTSANVVDI